MTPHLSATSHPVAHQNLTEASAAPSNFAGKDVTKSSVENNIIQKKIKQLQKEGRKYSAHKCISIFRTRDDKRIEKTGSEPSPVEHISLETDTSHKSLLDASALLYTSKGEEKNFNGKVFLNNKAATCSHLSHLWLAKDKFKYEDISSKESIKKCCGIHNILEIKKNFCCTGCPSEGIYFEVEEFPKAIYNVAKSLNKGQEKRYLLNSIIHVMGLWIKKNRDNNIIIYYYDPNDTLRHRKIITKTEHCLKNLISDDFFSTDNKQLYFTGNDKVGCLLSLDTKALQEDCNVVCINHPSAELIFLLSQSGHYGHSDVLFNFENLDIGKQNHIVAGKNTKGTSALYTACYHGHAESVNALLKTMYSIDLSPDERKELLSGKNSYGVPALYIACKNRYDEVVKILLETMCRSDINLDMTEREELMAGKSIHVSPVLFATLQQAHSETLKVYLNAVLSSPLNTAAKERLLTIKTSLGLSALEMAINNKKMDAVNVFVDIVKNSNVFLASEIDRCLKPYYEHVLKNKSH